MWQAQGKLLAKTAETFKTEKPEGDEAAEAAGATPAAKTRVWAALWEAMKTARASSNITNKSRKGLISALNDMVTMNDAECSGLVTHIAEREHPELSEVSLRVVLAMLKASVYLIYICVYMGILE